MNDWQLEAFGELWADLLRHPAPRPVHKDQARRTFRKRITQPVYPRLAAALATYRASRRVHDGYVQDASTWLNDWECWEGMAAEPASDEVRELAVGGMLPADDEYVQGLHARNEQIKKRLNDKQKN